MSRFTHPRTRNAGHSREAGQSLVLFAVLLMGLLGVAGLAIDFGFWSQNKTAVQSAADASALAGASQIPAGQASATSHRPVPVSEERPPPATAFPWRPPPSTPPTTRSRSTPRVTSTTWFTNVFGIHSVTVKGSARATIESFTTVNGINVMPWGVLKASYVTGQRPTRSTPRTPATPTTARSACPTCRAPAARCPTARASTETRSPAPPRSCPVSRGRVARHQARQQQRPDGAGTEHPHHQLADRSTRSSSSTPTAPPPCCSRTARSWS